MTAVGDRRTGGRVLALSYLFPPVGGGSSQRNLGLARRFPGLGYECTVVTGSGDADHFWAPHVERPQLPDGVRVVRVPGPEPEASSGMRRRVERLLDRDGAWYRWWLEGAYDVARREVAGHDVVYASLEPYETAFVADRLHAETGTPWVADLLDPWALDEMRMHVSLAHRLRDRRKMRRALRSAAAIVMSTPEATLRVREELPELAGQLRDPIPVGFEAEDFDGDPAPRDDGVFRIVHTGYLHTEAGLRHRRTALVRRLAGGLYDHVDLLTRSHVYLLDAVASLVSRDPAARDTIRVHLAGALSETDRQIARRFPGVELHGFLTHAKSVELLRSADLLFLPMHDVAEGAKAGLVPAKTYEYLAAGRPILAAVPDGDARALLLESEAAYVCRPSDVEAMTTHIADVFARWQRGEAPRRPRADVVARYERSVVAERLAAIFADVAERARGRDPALADGLGRAAKRSPNVA